MVDQSHIIVLPSPGLGHVTPLLELSKHLVIHHHFHVTFLRLPSESSAVNHQLFSSATLPPGLQIIDLPPPELSDLKVMDLVTRLYVTIQHIINSLPSVFECFRNLKVEALIVDMFCINAIDIAQELSIPTYVFYTSSAYCLAFTLHGPTLDQEINGDYSTLEMIQPPGCKPISMKYMSHGFLDPGFIPMIARLSEASGILSNTWEDLEPFTIRALRENPFFVKKPNPKPPVYVVGPLIRVNEALMVEERECLRWLDQQPENSVVYVSFGSGGTLPVEQVTELALGLELSKQRFIWVVRKPFDSSVWGTYFGENDENNPEEYLPKGFLERTKGLGLVFPSWGPQVAVLSHVSTGGFLTHCGWNSVLESVVHGVPMIAWPLFAEQGLNAWFLVEEMGVAVRVAAVEEKGIVGREKIAKAVRMVVEGEEGKVMKRRTVELQESARKALSCRGSSFVSLSHVAESWKSLRKNSTHDVQRNGNKC